MNLRSLLGLKPTPTPADWVRTGAERWVVIKRQDTVVREARQLELIDLDSGVRRWTPALEFSTHHPGVRQDFWAITRIRTLTEQELAAE